MDTPKNQAVANETEVSSLSAEQQAAAEHVSDAETEKGKESDLQKDNVTEQTAKKKRRRRWGDRSDGRRLRTTSPMLKFVPYIMARRSDAQNTYSDSLDITHVEQYCRRKVKEGYTRFGFLHVFLAAYVRVISQRPGINRFISGQKAFARNDISVVMTIKRGMSLETNDTCIKVHFDPTDTIDQVYEKFDKVVQENCVEDGINSFDKINKLLLFIPGLLLRWTVKFLFFLDYFGWLPKSLLELSPFHGSMIITSMGSLGIKPIYHHIYDFGNLPIFVSYGTKRSVATMDKEGNMSKRKYIDIKVVTDERICDGYYYASAFKLLRRYIENPEVLETPPEQVFEDIE